MVNVDYFSNANASANANANAKVLLNLFLQQYALRLVPNFLRNDFGYSSRNSGRQEKRKSAIFMP